MTTSDALTRLRAERPGLSAIERRIADYVLENAQLLRDYSSQQLADTLKVSQSSVVKFAQRLGYKGYPDFKLAVTESLARAAVEGEAAAPVKPGPADPDEARAEALWRRKTEAEQETRAANPPETVARAAGLVAGADTLFVAGDGIDGQAGQALARRMSMLGLRCFPHGDWESLLANLATASARDTLLVICEHGRAECVRAAKMMRAAGGKVVAVTRIRSHALVSGADACLAVVASGPESHVEDLVYEAALHQVLDDLFLRVHAARPNAAATFIASRRRGHAIDE